MTERGDAVPTQGFGATHIRAYVTSPTGGPGWGLRSFQWETALALWPFSLTNEAGVVPHQATSMTSVLHSLWTLQFWGCS